MKTPVRLRIIIRIFGVLVLFLAGCVTNPPPLDDNGNNQNNTGHIDLAPFGTDATLEIATWNIRNFPSGPTRNQTIADVVEIIRDLDIDVFAVQEIADTTAFRQVLDSLADYAGVYSSDTYSNGYQKTGVIYRKTLLTLTARTQLFEDDWYAFPRPPLKVHLRAERNGKVFDFNLIVLHLKAKGGSDNIARRRDAVQKLHQYVTSQIQGGDDPDYVLAGDWNDELLDPDSVNVFLPFLNDAVNFVMLTLPLAQQGDYSYIGYYRSLIDHIVLTTSIQTEFPDIVTEVIHIDEVYSAYKENVSDHRPVATRIPVWSN